MEMMYEYLGAISLDLRLMGSLWATSISSKGYNR